MSEKERVPSEDGDARRFLSKVPGFDRLDDASLEKVVELAETREYGTGDLLMKRGEEGDSMHVIVDGSVSVPVVDDCGRRKLTISLGPRELVGEMALLTGAPRTADVIADEPVRTLVLSRDEVSLLLSKHPELARFLAHILARRLGEHGGIQTVGKYRLVGVIGEGSNGKVYRALHPTLNRVVAVKMLSHDLVHQPGFKERFLEEARTLAGLSHENIVDIYDTEEAFGTVFIVMEAVEGSSLEAVLKTRGRIEPAETSKILLELASALSNAHERGIAHRDIKPANVAMEPCGRVKLMDFGLARAIREDPDAKTTTIDGTPQYLAPEIAMGRQGDGRVDVYALGIMAFEMITGRPPFQADSVQEMLRAHVRKPPPDVRSLVSNLPAGLAEFIEEALVKDPARRLSCWRKVRELLSHPEGTAGAPDRTEEHVLRIRFVPELTDEVDRAVFELKTRLPRDKVNIAVARLREDECK